MTYLGRDNKQLVAMNIGRRAPATVTVTVSDVQCTLLFVIVNVHVHVGVVYKVAVSTTLRS